VTPADWDEVMTHVAHLPFERTFGPEYPELLKKQDLANGYQKWVKKYGIVGSQMLSVLSSELSCYELIMHHSIYAFPYVTDRSCSECVDFNEPCIMLLE
jgi:hypothetical protein